MPTLFQQNDTFYLTVNYKGTRLRRSLGTSDLKIARRVAKHKESQLLMYLIGGVKKPDSTNLPLSDLINYCLAHDHGWVANTHRIYKDSLNHYLRHGLPSNTSYHIVLWLQDALTDAINGDMKKD